MKENISSWFLKWDQIKTFKMTDLFFSSSRFLPRMPTSFPFNTSIMYKKTVFVEYMDHLFNMAKPRPPWMGNENNTELLIS